jgi:hypothetical protein
MADVVITTQLQSLIDNVKTHPIISDVIITEVPPTVSLPNNLSNPLQFGFLITNTVTNQITTATIFVPDSVYNDPNIINLPLDVFVNQVSLLVTYDGDGTTCTICNDACKGNLMAYIDPTTLQTRPLLGFEHTPVDLSTVDVDLQTLVSKIKQIPGINEVVLYVITDPHVIQKINSTSDIYRCYCYYGESRDVDGLDNVSITLTKEGYSNLLTHDNDIVNITNLIQQNKEKNNQ